MDFVGAAPGKKTISSPFGADDIMGTLSKYGYAEAEFEELAPQICPSPEETLIEVLLHPNVYRTQLGLVDKMKKVYVDRNFQSIFHHVRGSSGWLQHKGFVRPPLQDGRVPGPVAFVQVSGPSGSGKSLATFAALRYLTGQTGRSVLYVTFNSVLSLALLKGDGVYYVLRDPSETVDELKKTVVALFKDLQPDGIFMDGCYKDLGNFPTQLGELAQALHHTGLPAVTTFVGVTTSMQSNREFFRFVAPLQSTPWMLDDYLMYAEALEGRFTSEQLSFLGCADGASLSVVKTAIKARFLVAGHSARFMFDRTTREVVNALLAACDSVMHDPSGLSQNSAVAINTLIASVNDRCVPVSVVAAGIIARNLPASNPAIMSAADKGHRPMLGWLFEEEVLDQLMATVKVPVQSTCTSPAATHAEVIALQATNTSADKRGGAAAPTQTVDSVAEALGASRLDALLTTRADFKLRRYDAVSKEPGDSYDFPAECYIIDFKDDIDLARQLLELVKAGKTDHPVLCIPTVYAYPFLDLLLLRWKDSQDLLLDADSFQITISDRHSCDATAVQSLSECMAMCGLTLTEVKHFAILTSHKKVGNFQFSNPQNMDRRHSLSRVAKTVAKVAPKALFRRAVGETDLSVFESDGKKSGSEASSASAAATATASHAVSAGVGNGLGEEEEVQLREDVLVPQETEEERLKREDELKRLISSGRSVPARMGTLVRLASDQLVLENSRAGLAEESIATPVRRY